MSPVLCYVKHFISTCAPRLIGKNWLGTPLHAVARLLHVDKENVTLALWLNLLSSHFIIAPGPPNGKMGLFCRSTEHKSCNLLQIFDTSFRLKFNVCATLLWESSCVNEKITRSNFPNGTLGNSANKLFVRKLLLFRHPGHLLQK